MITNRKDLLKKIYYELINQGFCNEHNYNDLHMNEREFIKTMETELQEYFILDKMHILE